MMGPLTPMQCITLARLLDAQRKGLRRMHVIMPVGSGGSTVALEMALRTLERKHAQRVLILARSGSHMLQLHYRLSNAQTLFPVRSLPTGTPAKTTAIDIGTVGRFMANGWSRLDETEGSHYDLIVVPDARSNESTNRVLDHFGQASVVGVLSAPNVALDFRFGDAVHTQHTEGILDRMFEQSPPPGMRMVRLGAIASIETGIPPSRTSSEGDTQEVKVIHATDIPRYAEGPLKSTSSQIVHIATLTRGEMVPRELMPGDIVLPRFTNEANPLRVAIIEDDDKHYASHSIIQIRITAPDVRPEDIIAHLRSDHAIFYLRVVSSRLQTRIRIAASDLAEMPVFIRAMGEAGRDDEEVRIEPPPVNAGLAALTDQLSTDIIPLLTIMSKTLDPDPEQMRKIADDLRKIASTIIPRTLDERILLDYPTPIALAWRRYRDARFNKHEQVFRLRDAFEAATFFIFNLTLADVLRRLDERHYQIEDKAARKSYKGGSMAHRLDFINTVWETAMTRDVKELFAPRLVDSSFIEGARRLQRDFRNSISHTATANESRLRKILDEFEPEVESLMSGLACLADIQMVRIPTFFFREGVLVRRVELYRGVVPQVDEQVLGSEIPLAIEYDHLVLLDEDERCLDLHPLYQLVESESTHHERHIFFMKSVRVEEKILMGESAHSPIEIEINGYSLFADILKRKGF